MEDVVTELKTSVFDKIARMICDKSRLKEELEQSNNILEHRLKISQERLNNYKKFNYNTTNDTTKFEYHNERVLRENSHMEMEIPLTKKRIDDMKHEIYEKDAESKNLKYQIYRFESEVAFLQEENRRVGKNVVDLQNEKKNIMAALVIMKKQTDSLKERVLKEDNKSKGFINDVSTLLHRGKVLNK